MSMTFNNMKELEKFINSKKGQQEFYSSNERELKQNLIQAGRLLQKCLQEQIDAYYDSYSPKVYERTYAFEQSLRLSSPKKTGLNEWSIDVYFDDDLAYHTSSSYEQAYVPSLIDEGWDIRSKMGKDIPRFTHYEGFNYIDKAVKKFNKMNKFGFEVKVIRSGKDTTGFTYSYGRQR